MWVHLCARGPKWTGPELSNSYLNYIFIFCGGASPMFEVAVPVWFLNVGLESMAMDCARSPS